MLAKGLTPITAIHFQGIGLMRLSSIAGQSPLTHLQDPPSHTSASLSQ